MPQYEEIRKALEPMLLTTGTAQDRLMDPEPLLALARKRTVLDVGCNVGTIAEAFAQQSAPISRHTKHLSKLEIAGILTLKLNQLSGSKPIGYRRNYRPN